VPRALEDAPRATALALVARSTRPHIELAARRAAAPARDARRVRPPLRHMW